ncbi:hypothetical protein [Vibrio gallaecicus]|uniref:hypothetical protein n=1 Tax=Vibrio gallaecicus TaxID=552386 RepID=UPI0025B2F7DC|nr:hypothetical protein [Vibrio gallaecicus]MDN3615306.1 hypothetical protein [Vibrio gallaecicus]
MKKRLAWSIPVTFGYRITLTVNLCTWFLLWWKELYSVRIAFYTVVIHLKGGIV